MNPQTVNLAARQNKIASYWSPEHILTANGQNSFKIATIKGDFIWHSHPDTDEVFYCISGGPFVIDIATNPASKHEDEGYQSVELSVGDLFNVPQGYRHRPRAQNETGILMIEKIGTLNTGDEAESEAGKERTKIVDEQN